MFHTQQDLPKETNFFGSDFVAQQSLLEKYTLSSNETNTANEFNFKNKEEAKSSFCFKKCKKDLNCQNSCYSFYNHVYEKNNSISKRMCNSMI
jgi:hypothetical protein